MMETATRSRRQLREIIDLGEFSLILRDETVESGEKLAAEVRALISEKFMKLSPALSIFYDLEIEETEVVSGSRKSKNKLKLKKKKGNTLGQKIFNAVAAVGLAVGLLSADYDNIPDNLERACQQVVAECQIRGKNVEITNMNFSPVRPDDA